MKNWKLFVIIILFVLFVVAYVISTTLLLTNNVCKNDIIIGAIGEGISFVGTVILGIVAFWQTNEANKISNAQLRRESLTQIVINGDASVASQEFSPKQSIAYSKFCDVEGVICSTQKLKDFGDTEEALFYEFIFYFSVDNAPLEKINIKEVKVNKQYRNSDSAHNFVDLNVLNTEQKIVFSYNPIRKEYFLRMYIHDPQLKLDSIAKRDQFALDIIFDAVSIYGTKQEFYFLIEIDSRDLAFEYLRNNPGKVQGIKLENVILHKGEPNYERS